MTKHSKVPQRFSSDCEGGTRLTLRTRAVGLVDYAPQMLRGMDQGWSQSLDKLAAHVAP